jgi:mannitol operon repressor
VDWQMPNNTDGVQMLNDFTTELSIETDRGVALVSVSYLDTLLESLVCSRSSIDESKIKSLGIFDQNGPMDTFSNKIKICYLFGLLNDMEQQDLNTIRKIRNEFAHQLSGLNFDTPSIADRCRNLYASSIDGQPSSARNCFVKAAVRIMVDLQIRATALT